jgi:hypothetical protein
MTNDRIHRGFTLIEAAVVMAIIIVLGGMAVSSFSRQRPRANLNSAASELQSTVHGARQQALATGHDVWVMVFPHNNEETGKHALSGYIYGRMHPAGVFCEKGIGVGRDGKVYINSMFGGWVRYAVCAYGPDGKSLNGKASRIDPNHHYEDQPSESGERYIYGLPCRR